MLDAGELCTRQVVIASPDESILAVARRIREHHVGSLVVVEGPLEQRVPVGILTDRDIVVHAVAAGGAIPDRIVRGCMNPNVIVAHEREGVFEVIRRMRTHGVRRLPVVDAAGVLQGILSLDDVLEVIAEEMHDLAALLRREREREMHPEARGSFATAR